MSSEAFSGYYMIAMKNDLRQVVAGQPTKHSLLSTKSVHWLQIIVLYLDGERFDKNRDKKNPMHHIKWLKTTQIISPIAK